MSNNGKIMVRTNSIASHTRRHRVVCLLGTLMYAGTVEHICESRASQMRMPSLFKAPSLRIKIPRRD